MRERIGFAFILIWIALVSYPLSLFTAAHLVTMPEPSNYERFESELKALDTKSRGWRAMHFLMEGCGCSRDVGEYLVTRGRIPELSAESVILIDAPAGADRPFRDAGFAVHSLTSIEAIERFSVRAAPMLVFLSGEDRIAYSGGYYAHRARTEVRDRHIFAMLADGKQPSPLPLFGCTMSKELREQLDPLGFKDQAGGRRDVSH